MLPKFRLPPTRLAKMGNLGVVLLYGAHGESATPPVGQHFLQKLHPTAGADISWHSHALSTTYQ